MLRFLLLLALLAFAHPAAAYQASVVFNGCNAEQQAAIRTAMEHVDKSLTTLLARFDRNELNDYLKAWFGSNPPAKVRERFQRIRKMLDTPRTLILACEERQCQHNLFGYAEGNSISLCPDFFSSKLSSGYDSQAGTLIHEFSHSYADTDDHAYGPGATRILARDSARKALSNADSYQYFFEAVTGEDVPHGAAAWNPENSCEWAYDNECDHPAIGTGSCQPGTDTLDCANHQGRRREDAQAVRKPSFGQRHPKDTCTTALDGTCDDSCAAGTDYTDCLMGTGVRK